MDRMGFCGACILVSDQDADGEKDMAVWCAPPTHAGWVAEFGHECAQPRSFWLHVVWASFGSWQPIECRWGEGLPFWVGTAEWANVINLALVYTLASLEFGVRTTRRQLRASSFFYFIISIILFQCTILDIQPGYCGSI
jgi:hypothetical protein